MDAVRQVEHAVIREDNTTTTRHGTMKRVDENEDAITL